MTGPLISADSHVVPLPTFWREYLPARFRDRAPRVESTDEGDFTVFEGRRTPVMAINSIAGKKREGHGFAYRRFAEQVRGGHDPRARLVDQERDGIVAEVLYGGGPLATDDRELFFASHAAYNDWLADYCSVAPDRLLGVAYVPMSSPDDAAAEIRRARGRGLRGALLPASPPSGQWWDAEWRPIFDALVETAMPAGLHVGFGFARRHRFDGGPAFMSDVVMTKMEMAQPLADLVFGGVLARHPELRVVSVEAYIGWLPFVAEYMDHAYRVHRWWNELGLAEEPSAYLRRQVYATFIDDPVGVRERHTFGVDQLMWSTDYPHGESTFPESRAFAERAFAGVPADETRKMVFDNARRLYGISVAEA
ncbi:MAG TPA: amidohydrolase family protein [Candidatus Binatia bacterium]|nr:amidohydrolase family protein [Candidatus Binatia bacterium]